VSLKLNKLFLKLWLPETQEGTGTQEHF